METIETLIAEKNFEKAMLKLEEQIKKDENNIDLLKNLGLCLVNLEKNQYALDTFLKVIELKPDDATSYFYAGTLYQKLSDSKNAIKYLKKVIELRKNYIDAYKSLTSIYVNEKKLDDAKETISMAYECTKDNNEDFSIPYMYANILILLKDTSKAQELLEEAIKLNPHHVQSLNTLGCLLLTKNESEKSFECYQKSIEIDPNNAITHYNIGTWYMIKNDLKNAKKHFKIAYKKEPIQQHLAQLALVQFKDKDYDGASVSYQNLCTKNPQSLTYRYNYAICLYEQKEYTQALSLLLPIVQQNPKSAKIAHQLALCFEALGQIRNAAAIYEKIIKLGKIPAEIYLDYAKLLVSDNDKQKAENILKKLLQINPDLAQAHKDLGVIYLVERLFDDAKQEFETALKLEPENPTLIFEYANYFQATADFKQASNLYEQALSLTKDNPIIHLMLGLNKLKTQDFKSAKLHLQKVLSFEPKNHTALYNLAQICYIEKNFETAKEYLTDAYLVNNDTETTNLFALTYLELNDYHNAKVLLNKLNQEIPNNPTILTTIAKAEMLDNNPEMAKNYIEQALAIFPEYEEAKELYDKLN